MQYIHPPTRSPIPRFICNEFYDSDFLMNFSDLLYFKINFVLSSFFLCNRIRQGRGLAFDKEHGTRNKKFWTSLKFLWYAELSTVSLKKFHVWVFYSALQTLRNTIYIYSLSLYFAYSRCVTTWVPSYRGEDLGFNLCPGTPRIRTRLSFAVLTYCFLFRVWFNLIGMPWNLILFQRWPPVYWALPTVQYTHANKEI